ncbi:1999_t:CDS:2, partial [Dentiscutata heterogama]
GSCSSIKLDPTTAISTVYKEIFNTQTCYSRFLALGWMDESIIEQLLTDNHGGLGYKSSLLRNVNGTSILYFSTIEDDFCAVEVHKDFEIKNRIKGSSPNEESQTNIVKLYSSLGDIYPLDYQFSNCEISAWRAMLCASSCQNITAWAPKESK